jgi:VWFA-related protein
MKKWLVLFVCLVAGASASARSASSASSASSADAQAPSPAQKPPQFETRADVVLVDVNVIDRDGNPVHTLTADDFVLEVNGQPRPIYSAQFISSRGVESVGEAPRLAEVSTNTGATSGRLLLFVVDENYLRAGNARSVLRTAERVMESLLPGDLVGLSRLPSGRGGVEFTTDRNRVRRALSVQMGMQPAKPNEVRIAEAAAYERNDRFVWEQVINRECGATDSVTAGSSFERQACISEMESQAKMVLADARARTRVSINAYEQLAERLATLNAPVNIVLLSEGLYIGQDRGDLSQLAGLAARARISFFIVQPDESMSDMDKPKTFGGFGDDVELAQGLEQLAGLTRGEYFKVATSGAGAFQRIAREISGYYLLGFEPTDADRTSKDRRIKVEVKRRGLTVRARSTYAVGDPVNANASLAPAEHIKQLLLAPLPSAGLPMRVATYAVYNPGDTRVRVILSAEIGEAATEPAEWPVGLIVIDSNDKVVFESSSPMKLMPASGRAASPRLLLTSLLLPPGEYTLRLAAVGADSAAGSVHHTIDARLDALGGSGFKASDLILTSELGAGELPRPTPSGVIDSESLTAVVELGSDDYKRLSGARVRIQIAESESSPPLVTSDTRLVPRNDELNAYASTMKLTMLPPGEYIARAVVSVPGQDETRLTRSFRYAPVASARPAARVAASPDEAVPLPPARIVAPLSRFTVDDVLKPEVVGAFLDTLQQSHPVSPATAPLVAQARQGTFTATAADGKAPAGDEPALNFIRGLAALQKKQPQQAAAWFQLTLKSASDFLGAAFYLGAVHAALGRDVDAVGAWQMSLLGDANTEVYPHLVDALLRVGDAQGALEMIAEAPDAWPSDEARLRRVVTAQAMLGQFTPALETLPALLQKQPDDVDLLFIAVQVLYKQHGERALSPGERQRFDEYTARYIAAGGAEKALVETWRKYVLR